MARIHRNGNMLIRLDSIVAVSSDMDKPKELAIFTNSPGIFKIHFEKDEEVTKYIDDLQTRIEKELPDSNTMSKKEKTNKDLTSKIIRSTFSRGEGHGKQDMLDAIDWAAKEMELAAGNIDCIWNGMSITDERLASMSMSLPYMNNQIVMVVKDSSGFASIDDMAGKSIGVQSGSFAEEVLETYPEYADFFASVTVLPYDEYLTALMDLQQGGVDGVLIDLVVAEYRIAGLGDDSLIVIDSLEDDLYGIGFRKEDVALRDKVDEILTEMEADGTIEEISTEWFGKNISIIGAAAE